MSTDARVAANIDRGFCPKNCSAAVVPAHSTPLWNLLILFWLFFGPLYPKEEMLNKFSSLCQ